MSDNITIDTRIEVTGNVHLILENDSHLNATSGIRVPVGSSLTIYAQSVGGAMGKLTAQGITEGTATVGVGTAGIGSNGDEEACGYITINGGEIIAIGGRGGNLTAHPPGAGIGLGGAGFYQATVTTITINGGRVTAQGGSSGTGNNIFQAVAIGTGNMRRFRGIPSLPTAATNVVATPGIGQVTLNWNEPPGLAHFANPGYEVRVGTGAWVPLPLGQNSHTFTDLSDGTSYTFAVRTTFDHGDGVEASASATTPLLTGITVRTQPRLSYTHGDRLNLSGLVATLAYEGGLTRDVAFADFAANQIAAEPAHGTLLSRDDHNGTFVTITFNNSSITANTNSLTVSHRTASGTDNGATNNSADTDGETEAEASGDNNIVEPPAQPTPPPTTEPEPGTGVVSLGQVEIEFTRDEPSAITLDLPQDRISEIIENSEVNVEFDLTDLDRTVSVGIPNEALEAFANEGLGISITFPDGVIQLDPEALISFLSSADADADSLRFFLEQREVEEIISPVQSAAVLDGEIVFEVIVLSGSSRIRGFTGSMALSAEYTGRPPDSAWYLADDGSREGIDTRTNEELGIITLFLPHLSHYVIGFEDDYIAAFGTDDPATPDRVEAIAPEPPQADTIEQAALPEQDGGSIVSFWLIIPLLALFVIAIAAWIVTIVSKRQYRYVRERQ